MYYCPKCHYTTDSLSNFCPICGAKTEVYEAVPSPTPVDSSRIAPAVSDSPVFSKPKMIIGGILGIASFVMALFSVLLFALPALLNGAEYIEIKYEAYTYAVTLCVMAIPMAIIGFLFSNGVLKAGADSGLSKAGRILAFFALIVIIGAIVLLAVNFDDVSATMRYAFSGDTDVQLFV